MQTGYYSNLNEYNNARVVSISGDCGRSENYVGETYKKLAPKYGFWKTWHEQIGKISEEENTKFYISHYYNEVLKSLNAKEVLEDLNNAVLLCYEKPTNFCHRHIVAVWLEHELGIEVPEVGYEHNIEFKKYKQNIANLLPKKWQKQL